MTAQQKYKEDTGRDALYLYQTFQGPQVWRRTARYCDWLEEMVDVLFKQEKEK